MIKFFSNLFGYALNFVYNIVNNYGLTIIIFSVFIKIIMLPLSIKQQKTMKQNEKIQKEMQIIQLKHNGNQEKINQEMMELYRREKINPFGGCLTVIIQFILIIAMFYLVSRPLTYMRKIDSEVIDNKMTEIKTEVGENNVNGAYPEIKIISYMQEKDLKEDNLYINMEFLGLDLSKVPQENITEWQVYIIPGIYVLTSLISIKITNNMMSKTKKEDVIISDDEDKDKKKEKEEELNPSDMAAEMNKSMSWMMPVLAVTVSLMAPLGLALYWLVNNITMIVERIILNKIFSKEEENV